MSCSTATAQQLSELQHSNSTAAFRAAAQQPSGLQHSSLQSCSTAAFRRSQNGAGHPRSASKSRAGGFASTLQPLRLQALRPPALKIALKVPNSTPCLETRPVAITEWELTTPSLERDELSQRLRFQTVTSETTETMRQPVVSLSRCLFVSRPLPANQLSQLSRCLFVSRPPCRQISCLSCLAVSLSPAPPPSVYPIITLP